MSRVHTRTYIYDRILSHDMHTDSIQNIINNNTQLLLFIFKLTLLYRAHKLGWNIKKRGRNKFIITRTFDDIGDYNFELIVSELIGCNNCGIDA